jgi:hypothetical protein
MVFQPGKSLQLGINDSGFQIALYIVLLMYSGIGLFVSLIFLSLLSLQRCLCSFFFEEIQANTKQ